MVKNQNKFSHPFYKLMELKDQSLQNELRSMTRLELIQWLCWNDRNGVYSDEDSLREFDNILDKDKAIEIITRQINEGRPIES